MKRGKLVLVKWNDSNVIHGWRLNNCNGEDVAHCQHPGFFMEEDDSKVTIAWGNSDCDSIMETLTIPKSSITSIKELRIK